MIAYSNSFDIIFSALGTVLYECHKLLSGMHFLLYLQSFSVLFKFFLLIFFLRHIVSNKNTSPAWVYFFIVLLGSCFEDIAWIASLLRRIYSPEVYIPTVLVIIRFSWVSTVVMYQSLALFIESFTQRHIKPSRHQLIFCCLSLFLILYEFFIMFYRTDPYNPTHFDFSIQRYISSYVLFFLMPFTLVYVFVKIRKVLLPKILKNQLLVFMQYYILPLIVVNIVQMFPFSFDAASGNLSIVALSSIVLTLALFYCFKKIIGLRFLNYHDHVHSANGTNFTDDFKAILDSLATTTSVTEVDMLTQRFFRQHFNISSRTVSLHVRSASTVVHKEYSQSVLSEKEKLVEHFLDTKDCSDPLVHKKIVDYLAKYKILILDEIEYNDFYEINPLRSAFLGFLQKSEIEIFLPIYEQDSIIAYITVEKLPESKKLYSDFERDEMLVFARFLGNVLYLLQNRNLKELLRQRKDALEELYVKHREICQYKESMRSFLRNNKHGVGVVFFKNHKFILGNEAAEKLLGVDPNIQEGHPFSRALRYVVKQVQLYNTTQMQRVKDAEGKQLIMSGIAHTESHFIAVVIHHPEISDIIKEQIDTIKDPSDWDYLLYLETTESGKLVNQLFPHGGEMMLDFKIQLLKLALSKKAVLLNVPEEDLVSIVELLHHISLREILYSLDLQSQVKKSDIAVQLFGINPLLVEAQSEPLLDKLNTKGTLFIKNVHLLDRESQDNLAQCIRYGFYTVYRSDKRVQSDVRIICSSNENLENLVTKGVFSPLLFAELSVAVMPQPVNLSIDEMENLVEGFTQQALEDHTLETIVTLTDKEKTKLSAQRPASFFDLKNQVQKIVLRKTQENNIYTELSVQKSSKGVHPQLLYAAKLGKNALKNRETLTYLWNHFQNYHKIALFLGVNRSSVYRRCKEFKLQ